MHHADTQMPRDFAAAPKRRAWVATLGSLLGAGALTACCILPLILVSAGITGTFIAQMTALAAYKWITIPVSAAFLGWGFWQIYRPARCVDGSCAVPLVPRRVMKAILWSAAALMIAAIAFPYVYDPFAGF